MAIFQSEVFWAVVVVLLSMVVAVRITVSTVLQQQPFIWNDIGRISETQTAIAIQISAFEDQLESIDRRLEEIRDRLDSPTNDRPMDEADHAHLLAIVLSEGGSDKTTAK